MSRDSMQRTNGESGKIDSNVKNGMDVENRESTAGVEHGQGTKSREINADVKRGQGTKNREINADMEHGRGKKNPELNVRMGHGAAARNDELLFALDGIERREHPTGWQGEWMSGQNWSLVFVVGGEAVAAVDGESCPLRRGDGLLLRPGTAARLSGGSGELLLCYELAFQQLRRANDPDPPVSGDAALPAGPLTVRPISRLEDGLRRLEEQREQGGMLARLRRHIRFQELLLWTLEQNGAGRSDADTSEAVRRTIAELDSRFCEKVTVEELAGQARIGVWQYRRWFKKLTGRSPNDYMTQMRIGKAKELLLATREPVADIARRVGYEDAYYFNRRFKQSVGLAPRQYVRERLRQPRIVALTHLGDLSSLGIRAIAADRGVLQWLGDRCGKGIERLDATSDGWERAAELRPDLILANRYTDPELLDGLKRLAPVAKLPSGVGMFRCLNDVAELLEQREAARRWTDRYEAEAERIRRTAGAGIGRGETALFVHVVSGSLYLYHPLEMPVLYDVLGFRPPAGLPGTMSSSRLFVMPEKLAEYPSDRLFVVQGRMPGAAETMRRLLAAREWQSHPAVAGGRVYFPDEYWTLDGTIALEWQLDGIGALLSAPGRGLPAASLNGKR